MRAEWFETTLEEAMAAIIDYRGKTPSKTAYGIPLITAKVVKNGRIAQPNEFIAEADYEAWMRRGLPKQGDVVITTEAPLGQVARLPGGRIALAQRLICLRGKPGILENGYLNFLLQSEPVQSQLSSRASGTTVLGIKQSELRKLTLLLPPIAEQQAVAHILGNLDDKIELNRRMNETLEAMARALFQSWFVDFDPVRAKAEGRAPGLSPHLADLFPSSFVDSELGEIPEGWGVEILGSIVSILNGFAFKSRDWVASGVPVVKIGSVRPGIIDLASASYVTERVAEQAVRFKLAPGDLLIGMTGYVGEVGLVPHTANLPLLNQRVGKFVLEQPGTSALGFLYCFTRQSAFKDRVISRSHGTAQANISSAAILDLSLCLPSVQILQRFNEICKPMLDRILANHFENSTLIDLRDTLLPKLTSGEIRVRDAERAVECAV